MNRATFEDQEELTNVQLNDPKDGGNEPDHSEDSDADSGDTNYDDSPN